MATYSLIIPMYNGEKYIANALGSLLPSASLLTEVILVDDRSTDNGVKVAHTFDNLLPMRYFVTDESMDRGPGNARQLGLDNACGEWIGFMDADDLLAPDALRYVDKAVNQCEYHRNEQKNRHKNQCRSEKSHSNNRIRFIFHIILCNA